jgi:hypothetical protein
MTRRQRNLARLNEDRLTQLYAVLVANCGADPAEEGRFLTDMAHRFAPFTQTVPWSFDGYLGDGGGFYFSSDGQAAVCCRLSDLDQETRGMLIGVNRIYGEMLDNWQAEDKLARARQLRAEARAAKAAEAEAKLQARAPRPRLSALAEAN